MGSSNLAAVVQTLTEQWKAGLLTLEQYQGLLASLTQGAGSALQAAAAPALVTQTVACPKCGGPLGEQAAGDYQTCRFCGHSFTIQRANEEIARLRDEFRGWLSQIGATGGGGAVDAASRTYIFRDKILPGLQREYNRQIEIWDGCRERSLIQTPADRFLERGGKARVPIETMYQQIPELRRMSGKLGSPDVKEFATSSDDERQLRRMQLRISELIYSANLTDRSGRLTEDGYRGAAENLTALQNLYAGLIEVAGDGHERDFFRACLRRWEGAGQFLDALQRIYASRNLVGASLRGSMETAEECYQDALSRADASQHSPMETIPWKSSVEAELAAVRILSALLRGYDRVNSSGALDFIQFQQDLDQFVERARVPFDHPQSIAAALDNVCAAIEARRGVAALPRINDWSWSGPAVEAARKKGGLFSRGAESVESEQRFWQPFWAGTLRYSVSQGAVFRSGAEQTGMVILDATSIRQTFAEVIAADHYLRRRIAQAAASGVVDTAPVLPALVSQAAAGKKIEEFLRSQPELRNARASVEKLIYAPMCRVVYMGKNGRREQTFSLLAAVNGDTGALHEATNLLMSKYTSS